MSLEVIFHNQQSKLEQSKREQVTLKSLLTFIEEKFKDLPKNFALQYLDEEQDLVEITCEEDFEIFKLNSPVNAVLFVYPLNDNSPKVFKRTKCNKKKEHIKQFVLKSVREMLPDIVEMVRADLSKEEQKPKPKQTEKAIHSSVRCDGCNTFPILGVRYKCTECPNFDFCEECEDSKVHDHTFLKIKKPEQFKKSNQKPFHCSKRRPEELLIGENCRPPMFHPVQFLQQIFSGMLEQTQDVKQQQEIEKQKQQEQQLKKEKEEQIRKEQLLKAEEEERIKVEKERKELAEQKLKQEFELRQNQKLQEIKKFTPEQEQKLLILSDVFRINPSELEELVLKFDQIPVDEIVEFVLDDPDFNNVLKRSMM